ncbi:MAG: FtsW/RodA/SpoVE family cell cycle protein, partial [Cyanobacteria bacterium J06627_15]
VGQAMINIGVASGALPTTGLPFPMMSYGGSSMISSLVIAGLLIRVAREAREADVVRIPKPEQPSEQPEPVPVRARRRRRTALRNS